MLFSRKVNISKSEMLCLLGSNCHKTFFKPLHEDAITIELGIKASSPQLPRNYFLNIRNKCLFRN